jgi:type I restriction enzyme S subunit
VTWPRVPLGEIFTIARGGSPRPIDAFITDDPGGVNWIMIGDATEGAKYISSTKKRIRREGVSRSRTVKPGDFLLTNSMSFGHPYILNTTGCIHDGWLVLSPQDNNVNQDYFYHLLGSPLVYGEFERLAAGAVVKNLNSDLVRGVTVPFPPLAEQRRIADILDKADAIRRKRKEAIALTEELLRSAFLEMFGDPVTNPKSWPVKPLGELVDIRGGGTPSRARPEFFAGRIPWATAKDFRSDFMCDTEEHVSEDAIASSATKLVPQGTILIVVKSKILMRRLPVAISTVPLCFNQDVKGLVARDLSEGPYIAAHIRMAQRKLLELARGVNTEGLTLDHLRGHPVMRPPIDEVRRFVRLEAKIHRSTDANARGAQAAEDMFNSLVARAFSGELS